MKGFGEVVLQRAKLNPKPRDPFDREGSRGGDRGTMRGGKGGEGVLFEEQGWNI